MAALRTGAGLVTVASTAEQFGAPELMAAPLPQCGKRSINRWNVRRSSQSAPASA